MEKIEDKKASLPSR